MEYTVQLKLINFRQVIVRSDKPLSSADAERLAAEQVRREYGGADYIEAQLIEIAGESRCNTNKQKA